MGRRRDVVHRYLDQIAVRLGAGSAGAGSTDSGAGTAGSTGTAGDPADPHAPLAADAVQAGAQFIWRDRLYVVREVLAYWSEATQWWVPISAEVRGAAVASGGSTRPAWAAGSGGSAHAARVGATSIAAVQVWRVVAGIGRRHPAGAVVDLIRHPDSGRWQLARTID